MSTLTARVLLYQVENQMVSAERILGYCKVGQEASLESEPWRTPGSDWPTRGDIQASVAPTPRKRRCQQSRENMIRPKMFSLELRVVAGGAPYRVLPRPLRGTRHISCLAPWTWGSVAAPGTH